MVNITFILQYEAEAEHPICNKNSFKIAEKIQNMELKQQLIILYFQTKHRSTCETGICKEYYTRQECGIIDGLPKIIPRNFSGIQECHSFRSGHNKNLENKVPYYTLRTSKDLAEVV